MARDSVWLRRWRRSVPPPPQPVVNSRDFTHMVVSALQYAWHGGEVHDAAPGAAGGVAVAAAAYARALTAATVDGPEPTASAIQAVLADAGVAYCRAGEFVCRVLTDDEGLALQPVQIIEGAGSALRPRWTVREIDPSGDYRDVRVNSAELLHVIWHPDESGLRGEAPWSGSLGRAAANVEQQLADEGRMPTGQTMAMRGPAELDDMALAEFYEMVTQQYGGRGGFLPHLAQGASTYTEPQSGSSSFLQRFGPEYSAASPQLQAELLGAVVGACGLWPMMLSATLGGSALRDGWRAFLSSSAQPVADELALAAGRVLGSEFTITVAGPSSHQTPADLVSRGRAFKSLTDGGIEADRALELVGLA